MQNTPIAAGRPKGARSYDSVIAKAFGEAVQQARRARGVSQEHLSLLAGIERAHVGKIERGEHLPTVVAVFKLAKGLECEAYELLAWVTALLPRGHVNDLISRAQQGRSGRSSS
jgi:transcriptional regulator with XRE-family HTH domain